MLNQGRTIYVWAFFHTIHFVVDVFSTFLELLHDGISTSHDQILIARRLARSSQSVEATIAALKIFTTVSALVKVTILVTLCTLQIVLVSLQEPLCKLRGDRLHHLYLKNIHELCYWNTLLTPLVDTLNSDCPRVITLHLTILNLLNTPFLKALMASVSFALFVLTRVFFGHFFVADGTHLHFSLNYF